MPSEASKSPQQAFKSPLETGASLPLNDPPAAELRGFDPLGILAILVILAGNLLVPPPSAVLVLVWVRWSGTQWRDIGYLQPRSWTGTVAIGRV